MSGCGDLCTAQQCDILQQQIDQLWRYIHYLEDRLGSLEQSHELLEASFEVHISQDIPEAHNYQPQVDVSLAVNSGDNSLKVFVKVDDQSDSATATLPEYEAEVGVSLAVAGNDLKVFVAVGDKNDSETIALPVFEPQVIVDAEIYNQTLAINVTVNDSSDIATVDLPLSNLKLDGSYENKQLTLTVADGESQDTATITLFGIDGRDGERGLRGFSGNDGIDGIDASELDISGSIDLDYDGKDLTANLTIGKNTTSDTVEIMKLSVITVPKVECVDGVAEIKNISVTVIQGTEDAELEKYQASAEMLKSQCELELVLEPVVAAPDWWQVRIGANRPQIVCVFRKSNSRTYHSLAIPHPAEVEIPTEPILPAYAKGNFQGMIILTDNSKFIVNCSSAAEAERICNIAASKIIGSYLPTPYKVWITERKGEPVGESQMFPTSIYYYSQGQKDLKPDWRFAIPPE